MSTRVPRQGGEDVDHITLARPKKIERQFEMNPRNVSLLLAAD